MVNVDPSPFAPDYKIKDFPVDGVKLAVGHAGFKYKNRNDCLLVQLDEGTQVAGVFTQSKCAAAPVEWCRAYVRQGKARALLVNAGNANAFTGQAGRRSASHSARLVQKEVNCAAEEVFLASTGVIGEPLKDSLFDQTVPVLARAAYESTLYEAAQSIMTTDTYPKLITKTLTIDGQAVRIAGIAKGSGMIAPDMATMLAFIFTDMPIVGSVLQTLLARHTATTFNAITVDSDTSTSDTLLCFATGKAKGIKQVTSVNSDAAKQFSDALHSVMQALALLIVRDGEGISKFVTVQVEGAIHNASADIIARSIANSPLVKTAIAGQDANWGRVVMAVGKAGEPADPDKLSILFGDILVAENGMRASGYDEGEVSDYMKGDEIMITVRLGLGQGNARIWTCDLTHDYIHINADYRS